MAESLVVELSAKTAKLDAGLKKTDKHLEELEAQTGKNDKALSKLSSTAGAVGGALSKTAVAGLALATALTAVVLKSAESQKELALLSRQAKLSTEDFEALSFATKQYGINAEQIADISKDISDKLGEFSKVGSGAFKDFADVVGLTKEEAMKVAREFENMSSDQVIGEMVRRMEEAGASSNQMTFALESMGNDLSRLIPLFTDSSKELKLLTGTYKKATEQMQLTSSEIDGLKTVATSFDLMTDSMSKAGTLISAQLAPLLSEFFNGIISVVPTATQAVVNFINTFRAAENIQSVKSLTDLIDAQKESLEELAFTMDNIVGVSTPLMTADQNATVQKARLNSEIATETTRLKELEEQLLAVEKAQEIADAKELTGGTISGTLTPLDVTKEQNEAKEQAEQEHQDRLAEIKDQAAADDAKRESDLSDLFRDSTKEDAKSIDKTNRLKEQSDQNYFNAASTLGNAFFEDNKAIKAGLVVVDTAAGISKAFAELPYPAALAASASIAATGIAQLAAIQGASKGGGGVSGGGGVVGADTTAEPEETSTLNVSDTDASGESQSQQITIKIDSDDNELAVALNGILGKAKVSGAIS